MSFSGLDGTPTGWRESPLGDVSELIVRGIAPSYVADGGVLVLNQKCIRAHKVDMSLARRNDHSIRRVPTERFLRVGDVLVNSTGTGTLGRVAQVRAAPEERTTVDTHVTIVRPMPGVFDLSFFGYALIAIEDQLAAGGQGAVGQTELPRAEIAEKFRVRFPNSLDEQKRIVAVLDQAFAVLDRARANVEANLAASAELPKTWLQELFENSQAWSFQPLADVCENLDRFRVPITKGDREPGETPYYGASGVVDHVKGFLFDEELLLVSEDGANLLARTYPIAFSISGKAWVNNHAHVLRFDDRVSQEFVRLYLNSISLKPYVTGMAQPKLNQAALNGIPVPMPPVEVREEIVLKVQQIAVDTERAADSYRAQLTDIRTLRQSILQAAFSGQLT